MSTTHLRWPWNRRRPSSIIMTPPWERTLPVKCGKKATVLQRTRQLAICKLSACGWVCSVPRGMLVECLTPRAGTTCLHSLQCQGSKSLLYVHMTVLHSFPCRIPKHCMLYRRQDFRLGDFAVHTRRLSGHGELRPHCICPYLSGNRRAASSSMGVTPTSKSTEFMTDSRFDRKVT